MLFRFINYIQEIYIGIPSFLLLHNSRLAVLIYNCEIINIKSIVVVVRKGMRGKYYYIYKYILPPGIQKTHIKGRKYLLVLLYRRRSHFPVIRCIFMDTE